MAEVDPNLAFEEAAERWGPEAHTIQHYAEENFPDHLWKVGNAPDGMYWAELHRKDGGAETPEFCVTGSPDWTWALALTMTQAADAGFYRDIPPAPPPPPAPEPLQ